MSKDAAAQYMSDMNGLDVRIAEELLQKARRDGVSLTGPGGLLTQITKTVLETALNVELDEHLGYSKGDVAAKSTSNEPNGTSPKTVRTDIGDVRIDVPRDREGSFEPRMAPSMRGVSAGSTRRLSRYMRKS